MMTPGTMGIAGGTMEIREDHLMMTTEDTMETSDADLTVTETVEEVAEEIMLEETTVAVVQIIRVNYQGPRKTQKTSIHVTKPHRCGWWWQLRA